LRVPAQTPFLTPGSEEMSLVQLYIPSEVSHDTISELAEMGNFQFKDVSGFKELNRVTLTIAQPRGERLPATLHSATPRFGGNVP